MIAVYIAVSVATAFITTKIMATHYFDVIDGYLRGEHKDIRDFMKRLEHMLEEIVGRKE